jgi:hypothetical protein
MQKIRLAPYAAPERVQVQRDGTLVLDGIRSRFTVQNHAGYGWTICEVQHAAPGSVAVFSTRRRVLQAIAVFCEGATRGDVESTFDTWTRAIRLCAATGSTSRLGFNRGESECA